MPLQTEPLAGRASRTPSRSGWLLGALIVAQAGLAACDSMLEVQNPNDVDQTSTESPAAASAMVNGSLSTVARGVTQTISAISQVSDELTWQGGFDPARELADGFVSNPSNSIVEGTFSYLSEGRWMADRTVVLLEGFDREGTLTNRDDLARAYLYAAIAYVTVADHFDDFVFSDRREAAPPIGEANMGKLYEQAVGYLTKGMEIARATGNSELELTLLAMRARAQHAAGVWHKLNPKGTIAADPLVDSPGAAADAAAFLARAASSDWKFRFQYSAATIPNQLGAWMNNRLEVRVANAYAIPDATGRRVGSIRMTDPVDGIPDPALTANVQEQVNAREFGPHTIVSAREMHLILAEAALARGEVATAVSHMNDVRGLFDELTPYDPAAHAISPVEMLQHLRRVNLFLQGRRLADQYRFGVRTPAWLESSDAVLTPGSLFSIVQTELQANCHLSGGC